MKQIDKGCKGFEKLLLALVRKSKDNTLQNEKWVNIWAKVADYPSYCFIHRKNEYQESILQVYYSGNISQKSLNDISKT
jgi:hypothetical protein